MPNTKSRYKQDPGHVKHLRVRRGRYLVQVAVPKALRGSYKSKNVERYIGDAKGKRELEEKAGAAVADIKREFARQAAPLTVGEIRAEAEAELRRAYDKLAATFADAHGTLPDLASAIAFDLSSPVAAEVNPNSLLGGATTSEYAEKLIRRAGAAPTEETVAALSGALLRAQAVASHANARRPACAAAHRRIAATAERRRHLDIGRDETVHQPTPRRQSAWPAAT